MLDRADLDSQSVECGRVLQMTRSSGAMRFQRIYTWSCVICHLLKFEEYWIQIGSMMKRRHTSLDYNTSPPLDRKVYVCARLIALGYSLI